MKNLTEIRVNANTFKNSLSFKNKNKFRFNDDGKKSVIVKLLESKNEIEPLVFLKRNSDLIQKFPFQFGF